MPQYPCYNSSDSRTTTAQIPEHFNRAHKLDTRDLIENDDPADMGSFKEDDNAWIFEFVIESIRTMGGV